MSDVDPAVKPDAAPSDGDASLVVDDLEVSLMFRAGPSQVVRDLSLEISRGETLALVGESGCGKSMTALAIMRLLPDPPARITRGRILLEGRDLATLKDKEMRSVRGDRVSMVFQEPLTSFDPVFTIGSQLTDTIKHHRSGVSKSDARDIAIDMLREVQIPEAEKRFSSYPHELSGGMRQRVLIAIALILNPTVLIADEPTTALDVTTQAQILDLIKREQEERQLAMLLITHNLAVVSQVADRVAVMYAGEIVETGPSELIFNEPQHPYTQGLLRAIPRMDSERRFLLDIPGRVPDPRAFPPACHFAPRCPHEIKRCWQDPPGLARTDTDHALRCWNPRPISELDDPDDAWRNDADI
jgi:oligopeptide/dipeptide ABC transporter ATP-binding protein